MLLRREREKRKKYMDGTSLIKRKTNSSVERK